LRAQERFSSTKKSWVAFSTDPASVHFTVAPRSRAEGDQFSLIFWHAPHSAAPPPSEITVERKGASQRAEAVGLEKHPPPQPRPRHED
jgi:hypothetical protein